MGLWGLPKSGKTHWAFSFPGPIAAIEIGETGVEDLAYKFAKSGKVIKHFPIVSDQLSMNLDGHRKILLDFEKALKTAVADKEVKTIVIDSMSMLWRSIRKVKTEEGFQESQRNKRNQADFELANDYHEQIVQVVRQRTDLNLVLVHRHRNVWAQDGEGKARDTGEVESRDYKGLENIVKIVAKTEAKGGKYYTVLELCRFDARLNGRVFEEWDYDKMIEFLFSEEE